MATYPKTVKGSKLLIQLGDGSSPETFAAPCGLTTKGINFTGSANEFVIPSCDTPDAPVFVARVIASLSAGVTGSGTLDSTSLETWREWFLSGLEKNIRVKVDVAAANGGGYYEMSAVLTTFNITGNTGELCQVEVEIQSAGAVEWVDAT